MKKFIFFILLVGLVFSCKKKQTIHITAKNVVTGKPYPGLKYSIVRSRTGFFESHYKTVASGSLNENGEAYITKRFSKNWSHSITLERPDNYCYANELHYYFSGGENVEANFEYAECGYLKLSIHNVNCQGASDTMNFRSRSIYSEWEGWSSARVGCYNYNSPHSFKTPAGWRIYEWKVDRNGQITKHVDSVFIDADQNNGVFQMNY